MKKYKSIGKLLAVSFLTAAIASACTEDAMDKINENPNNPLDAPAKFLITDLGVSTAFSTVGGDFSLYSSVYIEHETGISNQLYRAEAMYPSGCLSDFLPALPLCSRESWCLKRSRDILQLL